MTEHSRPTSAALARTALTSALEASTWKPGEKLPAERELADSLGVNRMSLRQALLALEGEGALFRIDRRGWFVAQKRFVYDVLNYVSFSRSASEQGTAEWGDLGAEVLPAEPHDAEQFGVAPNAPLLRVHGWGAFNGHRIYMHDVLINCTVAPDYPERLAGRSFTRVWIEDFAITPKVNDVMIRPVRLEGQPQQMLGCSNGAPGLYIRRIKTDDAERVIQIDREFWRLEALELHYAPDREG